jgi:hypothetical protein
MYWLVAAIVIGEAFLRALVRTETGGGICAEMFEATGFLQISAIASPGRLAVGGGGVPATTYTVATSNPR